jgi:hypothetical protein
MKTRLSQAVGDADASGVAAYSKWSAAEYLTALNYAIDLVKENYLLPLTGGITWVENTFNYAPPTGMVYLYELRARRGASNAWPSVTRTPEVYEVEVPLDWVSIQRKADNTLEIHFDEEEIKRRGFNQTGLVLRVQGYKYQAELSADADILDVPWSIVLLLAKMFLHMSGMGRDHAQLMKHLQQWRAAAQDVSMHGREDYEIPGGIWLDQA